MMCCDVHTVQTAWVDRIILTVRFFVKEKNGHYSTIEQSSHGQLMVDGDAVLIDCDCDGDGDCVEANCDCDIDD